MQRSKKHSEKQFLKLVLSAEGIPQPISIAESEEPDFLLAYEDHVAGVEVTQLYRPQRDKGSRTWEGACEGVLRYAARHWEKHNLPPLHISVTFNKHCSFPKLSQQNWGESLVSIVRQALPLSRGQAVIGVGPEHLLVPINTPSEFVSIIITQAESQQAWWTLSTGGAISQLSRELVQAAIKKKDALVPKYRLVANVLWLIIGIDKFRYSADYSLSESSIVNEPFPSAFDRVFLVPNATGLFYELWPPNSA